MSNKPWEIEGKPTKALIRLNIEIDSDLHARLKKYCTEKGISMRTFCESLIEYGLEQANKD